MKYKTKDKRAMADVFLGFWNDRRVEWEGAVNCGGEEVYISSKTLGGFLATGASTYGSKVLGSNEAEKLQRLVDVPTIGEIWQVTVTYDLGRKWYEILAESWGPVDTLMMGTFCDKKLGDLLVGALAEYSKPVVGLQ